MNRYILNGRNMTTREAAYDEIIRALEMPPHFGRNLDALWDELSCLQAEILLEYAPDMLNALEGYGCKILETMFDAATENPKLSFRIEN